MKTMKLAAIAAFALAASPALAATATGTLTVTASVKQQCTISNAALAFGAYDPVTANAATALTANTNFSVACTKGSSGVTIGLSGTAGTRKMTSAVGGNLTYELYSDLAMANVWDSLGANAVALAAPGSKAAVNVPVYGKVAAGQDPGVAADFSDSVIATINF